MTKQATLSHAVPAWGNADRLDLLQTFVCIVEAGSLSAAATQLRTTQPTVSRRLQQLERLLGCRLLHRSTHSLRPSEEGERCYRQARELLAGWTAFETGLQGRDPEPAGLLRVVVPHAFGQQLLTGPLADYLRRHPRVSVEWILSDTLPDFAAEGIDCAIVVGEVAAQQVVAVRLAEVPRIAVAAPSLLAGSPPPADARALARLPWLALKTFYHRDLTLRNRKTGATCELRFEPRFSTDNLYALRHVAEQGLGVAVGSSWLLREAIEKGSLVQVAPEWEADPLPVSVIYPYAKVHPSRLRSFVDQMRQQMTLALGGAVKPPSRSARNRS